MGVEGVPGTLAKSEEREEKSKAGGDEATDIFQEIRRRTRFKTPTTTFCRLNQQTGVFTKTTRSND